MRHIAFAATFSLLAAVPAFAQQWGALKGQVVWNGPAYKNEAAKVDKDQAHCLAKGQLIKDELIIDSKSSGIKDAIVWLAPVDPKGKIPIHPKLQAVPSKAHEIDQPCCLFEPRISAVRAGQQVIVKNSAPVAHNARISGRADINGTINLTIPPGGQIAKTLKAEPRPLLLNCDIHGWMGGRIAVFDHPYVALTKADGTFEIKDAPAGNYLLYIQHEKAGWLHTPRTSKGQPVTIKADGTLDLGKFEMKPEHLN